MCALQQDAGGQRREDRGGKCAVEPDEGGPAGLAAGALGQEVPGGVEEAGGYYQAQGEEGYEVVLLSVGPRHTARRTFASTLRPFVSLTCAACPRKGAPNKRWHRYVSSEGSGGYYWQKFYPPDE